MERWDWQRLSPQMDIELGSYQVSIADHSYSCWDGGSRPAHGRLQQVRAVGVAGGTENLQSPLACKGNGSPRGQCLGMHLPAEVTGLGLEDNCDLRYRDLNLSWGQVADATGRAVKAARSQAKEAGVHY